MYILRTNCTYFPYTICWVQANTCKILEKEDIKCLISTTKLTYLWQQKQRGRIKTTGVVCEIHVYTYDSSLVLIFLDGTCLAWYYANCCLKSELRKLNGNISTPQYTTRICKKCYCDVKLFFCTKTWTCESVRTSHRCMPLIIVQTLSKIWRLFEML